MLAEFLVFGATVLICMYLWQKHKHQYWKRQGVKYVEPTPIFGNMKGLLCMQKPFFQQMSDIYNAPGMENEPLVGIYMLYRPALLIRDVELAKRILVKDFNSFSDRSLRADPHRDPLGSNNLFFARNPEWRELRAKLTPVFSSGKIKQMYPLMVEIGKELENLLSSIGDDSIVEIKEICGRFTTDVIGTLAFGIQSKSLSNPKSEFYIEGRAMFALTLRRGIEFICTLLSPALTTLLRVKLFPKRTAELLRSSVKHVMEEREKSGTTRNDLIDTLISLKRAALAETGLSKNPLADFDYLVAQAALFFTAGFETSSSTMTFTLFELSRNQSLQDRLRAEINATCEDGQVTYEKISEMPLLSQVFDETLRKYPILGFLDRVCTPQGGASVYSLEPFSDFEIPKGLPVYVSAYNLHHDGKYWPDPEKFDPSRFAPENRANINWNAYMPFGIGPHNCIGMRVGLLQTKLGLIHLLKNHRVDTCEKTIKTIKFNPKSVVMASQEPVYLKLTRV